MMNKLSTFFVIFIINALFLYIYFIFPNFYILHISYSLLAVLSFYFLFNVVILGFGIRKIKNERTKYSFKKISNILFYLITSTAILNIWIPDPKTLLFSLGVLGAGITLAAQDLIKNFLGGIVIIINNVYKTGDRIEVEGQIGDIININILYTYMLECSNWIDGDQATGRIITVPNSKVLTSNINNYTKDHDFLWDEIFIPISYGSDWEKAEKIIKKIAKSKTKSVMEKAERGYKRLKLKYYVTERNFDPECYITITDNWITLRVRYITEVKHRRTTKNELNKNILKELALHKDIGISSSTTQIEISSLPELKIKK